jgi:catechol 2,3-dioxygenase-like lactoylglutathione lyase family enzyme
MRYVHTNLVARDWRRLAAFYRDVFDCAVGAERELAGPWLERGSGISGARIEGVHLKLPGYGHEGPTLELFQYTQPADAESPTPDRPGLGHIAFEVEDVDGMREKVIAAGGSAVGSIETVTLPGTGEITWTYVRDPEGNIIELQRRA